MESNSQHSSNRRSPKELYQRAAELEALILEQFLRNPGDWIGLPPLRAGRSPKEDPEEKVKVERTQSPRYLFRNVRYQRRFTATRSNKEKDEKKEEPEPDLSAGFEHPEPSRASQLYEPISPSNDMIRRGRAPPQDITFRESGVQVISLDNGISEVTENQHSVETNDGETTGPAAVQEPRPLAPQPIFVKEEELEDLLAAAEEPVYIGRSNPQPHVWPHAEVKIKKEVIELSVDSVKRRLDAAGAKRLDTSVFDFETISRAFRRLKLTKIFGGNRMVLFSKPNTSFCLVHQTPMIFYPEPSWNPHAPRIPGAPGLFLVGQADAGEVGPVFVKLGTDARWTYMGHYEFIHSEPLTKEEFAALDDTVKSTICSHYLYRQWGKPFIASLLFKKQHGRDGSEEELEEVLGVMKPDDDWVWYYLEQTIDIKDVYETFAQGENRLNASVINCVRYDMSFQKMIIERAKMSDEQLRVFNNRIIVEAGGRPIPAPKVKMPGKDRKAKRSTAEPKPKARNRLVKGAKTLTKRKRDEDKYSDIEGFSGSDSEASVDSDSLPLAKRQRVPSVEL